MRKSYLIPLCFFFCTALNVNATHVDEGSIPSEVTEMPGHMVAISTFPNELTVDALVSLSRANYPLQLGAFRRKSNADALCLKLENILGIDVEVIPDNGLFKVKINPLAEGNTLCYYIPVEFTGSSVDAGEAGKDNPDGNDNRADNDDESAPEPELVLPDPVLTDMSVPDTTHIEEPAKTDTIAFKEEKKGRITSIFMLRGNSPWLKKYNYFGKSVALVNALLTAILISVGTMIVLLVIILLNRKRMEREEELKQFLLEKYQNLIIDYLFGNTSPDKFRAIASDIYRRQVLIDQMIDVSVNLKGDAEVKLTHLYKELGLDHDSIARANSRRWHKKIKGFRELAFMGITDANHQMYNALNSKNEILRMEAQIALVRLSEENPFGFLSQLKRPFSLWEQISLHELIVQHEITPPEFKKWLTSSNFTVVMFALRMIREFKQKDAEPDVLRTLLHRDNNISHLAIQVAGDLEMRSTLDTLKRMYKFQDYNSCLEIVRSMGKMPDPSMLNFLKLVLDKEDDVQLQIEATKAIENMGEEGVKALVKIMKSEYKNYSIIVRHVLDRRIY